MSLEFDVPPEVRTPGLYEVMLWDTVNNRPLEYRWWISAIIPTAATVFEADPVSDRVVAAVGEDGTSEGTGGKISVYRFSTGRLLYTVEIPLQQRVLVFSPDTRYAWITQDESQGRFARLDLHTKQIDHQIQAAGFTVGGTLTAQAYQSDPRIVIVQGGGSVVAYADGLPLPGPPPTVKHFPWTADENGRLIIDRWACELNAMRGFENCIELLPGSNRSFEFVWGNKGLSGYQVYNLETGQLLVQQFGSGWLYLPESDRLWRGQSIRDGDSLVPFPVATERPVGRPRRVWAPDCFLSQAPGGILVGRLPELGPRPSVAAEGVVHAATGESAPIAPGEIISIYGEHLGPPGGSGPIIGTGFRVAVEVEHTRVVFNGYWGGILYTGPNQINVVVPEGIAKDQSIEMQVLHHGLPSERIRLPIAQARPGLFGYATNGRIYAAAVNQDGAVQGPGAPLRRGTVALFYATGVGLPAGQTADSIAPRPAEVPDRPSITIGGRPAEVLYAGAAPGLTAGLTQLNVRVPEDAPSGEAVEVSIAAAGVERGNVWVAIQ